MKEEILNKIEQYLKTEIYPKAAIIDRDSQALKKALQGMGKNNLLTLKAPKKWGGKELSEVAYNCFQIMIARYSGALAFLQTQHQSAASQIAASNNDLLKEKYLAKMATGEVLIGVGFSQLRRQGEPLMKARLNNGKYELIGEVPWVTGFDFFQHFIIGATLPDGGAIYGILPLENSEKITISSPMKLIAMAATNTVSVKVQGWQLEKENIFAIKPVGAIQENDQQKVLHHGFFALGCAQAGLDIMETVYEQKKLPFVKQAQTSLNQEVNNCREKMLTAAIANQTFEEKLELRAKAINLAGRCAQGAVTVSSGAANYWEHPAGRIYRESLMFTVFGQTTAVMEATLKHLTSAEK